MKIRIKKLDPEAVSPEYKSNLAAGFDLVSLESVTFQPGDLKMVKTGIAVDVGPGYQLEVRDRSGMVVKTPLRVANSPGTVDADYRGEVCVILEHVNIGAFKDKEFSITKGERIAQGVVMPAIRADIEIVDYLDETGRGAGGFGSTGK